MEHSAGARAFLEARDFLLEHRSAYAAACAGFRWPQLGAFNWALDYFDAMAAGNDRPALRIVRDDGTDRCYSFAELRERVRMALGAQPMQVRGIVMEQGLIDGGIGIGVGAAGAFALSRVLQSVAVGVSPRDPIVFAATTVVLGIVMLAAGYIPVRKATRIDPLEALRSD